MSGSREELRQLFFTNLGSRVANQVERQTIHGDQNIYQFDPANSRSYTSDEIIRQCLDNLQCPDTLAVKTRLKESKDKLLKEALAWMHKERQYLQWVDGDDVCLLWIKGGAGRGKTMMSIGIIEKLFSDFGLSSDKPAIVTYFFCQNADRDLNTAESIVKGLLRRLIDDKWELGSPLHKLWNRNTQRPRDGKMSLRELWDLFTAVVNQCRSRRVYVVIDALDECSGDGMSAFLRLVVRDGLDRPSKLKWLLTSRPLDAAERTLLASHEQVYVSLDFESANVSQAVENYVLYKVGELDRKHRYRTNLRKRVEQELISRAEGTFLWVSLVCKQLEEVSARDTLLAIQSVPPGLDALYARVLDELSKGDLDVAKGCMRLLKAMLLAYRPLHVTELAGVAGLPHEIEVHQEVIERCASFVKKQGNDIAFIRQSARNYLSGSSALDIYNLYGHEEIVRNLLDLLTRSLKVNPLGLPRLDSTYPAPGVGRDSTLDTLLSQLEYAATFWVQHLNDAGKSESGVTLYTKDGPVDRFLSICFLQWIECLSLLQKLDSIVRALRQYKALLLGGEVSVHP